MKGIYLLRAESPITHGASTAGNEQLIRRTEVSTPVGIRHVPILSGNGLRHRLLREPLADHISSVCGLDGEHTKESLRWLYHGGALSGASPNVDVQRIVRLQQLMPHVEAIGCSLPDTILAGKLQFGMGWLACSETMPIVRSVAGEWADGVPRLAPADEFLGRGEYYRHDSTRQRAKLMREADRDGKDNSSMPHAGEHVIAGAIFVGTLHAPGLSELGAGSILFGIQRWIAAGATVGGQSSRGHGVVSAYLHADVDWSLADKYREHVESNAAEIKTEVLSLYRKGAA